MLKLSDFDYNLPKELIAQHPLRERDSARMLVLDRSKKSIEHRLFKDIKNYLKKDDLLVLNNTKVLPSRLFGKRLSGGKVEILLLKLKGGSAFNALLKPARLKLGEKIIFNGGKIFANIRAKNEIEFNTQDIDSIYNLGVMPLPPYIKRDAQDSDNDYYQTVYAKEEGAIASPTAGLHFTKSLIDEIKASGVKISYVTLHVGLGTFKPVKVEDVTMHKMAQEYFCVPDESIKSIEDAKIKNSRIFTVGTTSLRALESYAAGTKEGATELFIYPGYKFKLTDCLLTNFHLPKTTLFILICAFCAAGASASGGAGEKIAKQAYSEAIDKKYRFYSYGDAMLII